MNHNTRDVKTNTVNDERAFRVVLTDPKDTGEAALQPIPVVVSDAGEFVNVFNEVSSVASGASVDVISYTVPVGKTLKLSGASASGDNYAAYTVEVDGSEQDKKRSFWGDFNTRFSLSGLEIDSGSIIKITVFNDRPSTANFNANLFGRLL